MNNFHHHSYSQPQSSFLSHHYGDQVYLLDDPLYLGWLARLGHPQTVQPQLDFYLEKIYSHLFSIAVNLFLPRQWVEVETRMKEMHPQEGVFKGNVISLEEKIVCVSLARAGILPSQVCFQMANFYFASPNVRQDHFYVNRKVNEQNQVVGIDFSGCKLGGSVENHFVFLPDPMGATGGTMDHVIDYYKKNLNGDKATFIALHLIITPESIDYLTKRHPDLKILSLRLDRGLSAPEVLKEPLGKRKKEEKGLNKEQYIVPGAGGVGEILNNVY